MNSPRLGRFEWTARGEGIGTEVELTRREECSYNDKEDCESSNDCDEGSDNVIQIPQQIEETEEK
jgi:hypothetical protein